MKAYHTTYPIWAALLLLATACSREELPEFDAGTPLSATSIQVSDGGFSASENPTDAATRARENGYQTSFTAGDACGLYVVRGGEIVYSNVKLTATEEAGALVWKPESGAELFGKAESDAYFLYYPYAASVKAPNPQATTDEGFFAEMILSWVPRADQSQYAGYTASDLMTARGTAKLNGESLSITFSMKHRMALAVIQSHMVIYTFSDPSIPDYTYPTSTPEFDGSYLPYYDAKNWAHRYIVNPNAQFTPTLTGVYDEGSKTFSITPAGFGAGSYRIFRLGGATEYQHTLQVGDYIGKDPDTGTWYIVPKTEGPDAGCVGMVFSLGHSASDLSDYTASGIGQKECRGYAMAFKDSYGVSCIWGSAGVELGLYPQSESGEAVDNMSNPEKDWSGYLYTQKIIEAAGGREMLNSSDPSHYPAVYFSSVYYEEHAASAPTNTSGWFLPAIGQMTASLALREALSLKSSIYWSSSERFNMPDQCSLYAKTTDGKADFYNKEYRGAVVRPILAF